MEKANTPKIPHKVSRKIETRDQSRLKGKQICMVVVLGRAGLLEEAEELIKSMLVNPDAII
jgi:pentatricopeptide repeat protein